MHLFDHAGAIIDSSEINSQLNNGILSRCTTVESNLTSVTCLCHSEYMTVYISFMGSCAPYRCMPELLNHNCMSNS